MQEVKALLIVDVQNDFCPGGKLAVPEADKVVAVINRYIGLFSKKELPIFASRDWHPKQTRHFKDFGGLWPEHCIQNTKGARFHPNLKLPKDAIIISKGIDPNQDEYSAFQARDSKGNNLLTLLKYHAINELYIAGLATDYCVKASCLDALRYGFKVKLLGDAIRGVDEKDSRKAIKEMVNRGARQMTFKRISRDFRR